MKILGLGLRDADDRRMALLVDRREVYRILEAFSIAERERGKHAKTTNLRKEYQLLWAKLHAAVFGDVLDGDEDPQYQYCGVPTSQVPRTDGIVPGVPRATDDVERARECKGW